jgi:hypothetical protein
MTTLPDKYASDWLTDDDGDCDYFTVNKLKCIVVQRSKFHFIQY